MKRCDTVMENIITWFKYLYIFHIICAGNSLLFDTPLLKSYFSISFDFG